MLIYCVLYEYWAGAIGSAIGFVAAVGAGLAFRSSVKSVCPPIGPIGGPYGNGPYRKAQCTPNAKTVSILAELATKLHDLPADTADERELNWQAFDEERSLAATANDNGDFAAAVRHYSAAIRLIMKQLRETRPTVDGDTEQI